MRISEFILSESVDGLIPFKMKGLGDIVILAGRNGAGKSRLLKLLSSSVEAKQHLRISGKLFSEREELLHKHVELIFRDNNGYILEKGIEKISLINYSHYDIPLQSPLNFPPYAISVAKQNLEKCNFEETARDVLLYIYYIAKYSSPSSVASDEFESFCCFVKDIAGIQLERDSLHNPKLFGQKLDEAQLSPGQQYLLRMCAALYCNKIEDDNFILVLDEPETHLHPEALWKLMEQIKKRFGKGQIWIATHSVALLSIFDPSAIWHIESNAAIKRVGSKSAPLIQGLIGDEYRRFQLQHFVASPDWFACNMFAAQCLIPPESKGVSPNDPQVQLTAECISDREYGKAPVIVVDYGAGKGRMIEGIAMDFPDYLDKIKYYAFNKYDDDANFCRDIMRRYDIDPEQYYIETEYSLSEKLHCSADLVFLVNVLHEIHPKNWPDVFHTISQLLKPNGKLIIVELEEFTYGEKAYDCGFLVLQEEAVKLLNRNENVICDRHPEKKRIMRFQIPKPLLCNMDYNTMIKMVNTIGEIALNKVKAIRSTKPETFQDYKQLSISGLKLAFWTQQFTDAHLILQDNL